MENHSTRLDLAFAALSDPTRRAIVGRLCEGEKSVSALAEPFDLTLPTLLKHVGILERSGIVTTQKQGRVRTCRIVPAVLQETEHWISRHIAEWESRLDRLEAHIDSMKE
ncbi:ArsR/SmtB family transcription factor [Tropicibacter sp. S64]|uniref:ArsR/SmtB family transcription factor n=1 Tax=Tropicibacter sp. S64 TaxID=3415122 RepID=UPI003C7CEFCC